jgi:diaminopimelate decarboxylase
LALPLPHLLWGNADCVELARTFGTPLYVMDESMIRARCAEVRSAFLEKWPATTACYASKAFLTKTMARMVCQEGLGLDVVSGGELHTALAADFPPSRIELHGNAKSERELRAALSAGVGRVIVDGVMELELLAALAAETGRKADILIRVAPGVNPHTHAHIVTGHTGSKFGLPIEGELLESAVKFALASPGLALKGFHFHIGSQIFENSSHVEAVGRIAALAARLKTRLGFEAEELNLGGGFGVGKLPDFSHSPHSPDKNVPSESHVPLHLFTDAMMEALTRECRARGLARPAVAIEPGRWIVAEAGITLYAVETIKRLPGVTYVGVDGGMPDNPRPSLYQAAYEGVVANKISAPAAEKATIAGKCCETGDILVESIALPPVERGDIVAIFNTGAYNFSMASNYNRLPRPAVVLVKDGRADVVVARQTHDDLLRGDAIPDRMR